MITMRPLMTSGLRHLGPGPSSRPGPLSHTNFSLDAIEIKTQIVAITLIASESLLG